MSAGGAVIMSVFTAIWWVAGARASGYGSILAYGIGLLVTGAIIVVSLRRPARAAAHSPEKDARQARVVGIASGAEGLAILVAVNVLVNMKHPDFIAPAVAVIVGLHFLPLARWLPARAYYVTSALLVALGTAGFWIDDAHQRMLAVSAGAASVLWLTSAFVLRKDPHR